MNQITITLPLPNACLSPNSRKHWRAKAKAKKLARVAACTKANWLRMGEEMYWDHATEQTTYYHKQNRRRDGDNHLSMLKAYFDGIVDAGILSDDSGLTHQPVIFKKDKNNPRVEILITKRIEP